MEEKLKKIGSKLSREDLLLQLAEECSELSHASLKMIRADHGIAYKPYGKCLNNLAEEMADVAICMLALASTIPDVEQLKNEFVKEKIDKWYIRAF